MGGIKPLAPFWKLYEPRLVECHISEVQEIVAEAALRSAAQCKSEMIGAASVVGFIIPSRYLGYSPGYERTKLGSAYSEKKPTRKGKTFGRKPGARCRIK